VVEGAAPQKLRLCASALLIGLLCGCRASVPAANPVALDTVATRYVTLALGLGRHDPNYVDAYYGPASLKAAADAESLQVAEVGGLADSLIRILGDTVPGYADSMVRLRHKYLRTQLGSMAARARMLGGQRLSFNEESRALYDVSPPRFADAHFDSLLDRLDSLLPGRAPLAERFQKFRDGMVIPAERVDTVFRTAIAACRARTRTRMQLPEGERFDLEYVKGTPWNAYNWYKGNFHSLIQVNLDFPIPVDRAVDLACHEGYPGHHVYNARLEKALFRDRGWVEISVYPLFSPQSLIAEGSANFGIDMAFSPSERVAFERDSLFPLAGLDRSLAELNASVRRIVEDLNYARNEVARRYLDGQLTRAQAVAAMRRYWLIAPDAAAKQLRFIDTYGSYVINYNLGRDLVAEWVQREGGDSRARRWHVFGSLLSSPRLASDLK
jgi:hypothetical protein